VKYAGLDVHDATVVVRILDDRGATLHTAIVPTRQEDIISAIRKVRGPIAVTFEEGPIAGWLRGVLQGRVASVTVCDPRRNRALSSTKGDSVDAYALAERLRLGALRPVYHGDDAVERLRTLAHHYDAMMRDVVRVKLRLRAVFRSRAIPTEGSAFFNLRHRRRFLRGFARRPAERLRAAALFDQLDFLVGLKEDAQAALVAEASTHAAFDILQSLPYVGPVRAAIFLAMTASPDRFENRRRIWRYSGLAVRRVGSGEHAFADGELQRVRNRTRTVGLDHRCNHAIKRILRQIACGVASGRASTLRHVYDQAVRRGKSRGVARTILARKIAATLLALWRSMKPFDPVLFATLSLHPEEASTDPFSAS
jgi:transposase